MRMPYHRTSTTKAEGFNGALKRTCARMQDASALRRSGADHAGAGSRDAAKQTSISPTRSERARTRRPDTARTSAAAACPSPAAVCCPPSHRPAIACCCPLPGLYCSPTAAHRPLPAWIRDPAKPQNHRGNSTETETTGQTPLFRQGKSRKWLKFTVWAVMASAVFDLFDHQSAYLQVMIFHSEDNPVFDCPNRKFQPLLNPLLSFAGSAEPRRPLEHSRRQAQTVAAFAHDIHTARHERPQGKSTEEAKPRT